MTGDDIGQQIARAKAQASPLFEWTFDCKGTRVEIGGRGVVAGRCFAAYSRPIDLMLENSADDPLLESVRGIEAKLRKTADRFHLALPYPPWTRSDEASMSPRERVDQALDEYLGDDLIALSVGPEELAALVLDRATPDATDKLCYRGVAIVPGSAGVSYVVGSRAR